jgi:hypothetical protein
MSDVATGDVIHSVAVGGKTSDSVSRVSVREAWWNINSAIDFPLTISHLAVSNNV